MTSRPLHRPGDDEPRSPWPPPSAVAEPDEPTDDGFRDSLARVFGAACLLILVFLAFITVFVVVIQKAAGG